MTKFLLLQLAMALAFICLVESKRPTGGTACNKRKAIGTCWRYCDATDTKWCWTGDNCAYDDEICASPGFCEGSCSAFEGQQGCVTNCPENSQGQSARPSCTPTDEWRLVKRCNNRRNYISASCAYEFTTGVSKTTSDSHGGSIENQLSVEGGFEGLMDVFKLSLGYSRTTNHNWSYGTALTTSRESKVSGTVTVGAGAITRIEQLVGRCGNYEVYTNEYQYISE